MTNAARVAYGARGVLLVEFGVLSLPTIGIPLLVTGVTLVALAPFRPRPTVFWSWLVAVLAFFGAYVAVAPLACVPQEYAMPGPSPFVAVEAVGGEVAGTNLVGIDHSGGPGHDPARWPAALAGGVPALGAGFGTRSLLRRRGGGPARVDGPSPD